MALADQEAWAYSEGQTVDYPNSSGSTILRGQVVDLGVWIGVAIADIEDGETGAIQIEGAFQFKKYTGEVISLGAVVYWDEGTNTASGTIAYSEAVIGRCIKAAASGDARVVVKLMPALG